MITNASHSSPLQLSYPRFLLFHSHTHILFPHFFCLIYLFFLSPWPSFLSTLWSFSQRIARADRKCGLCWVWAHQCSVYCPNLRELALKTKSRASEPVEVAGEGEEAKQDQTGLYICLVWGVGLPTGSVMMRRVRRGSSEWCDWCRATPIPPIVPCALHHASAITLFLNYRM